MARYHLSPQDGKPRVCSARYRCDYADANDGAGIAHYNNKAEAMKAYAANIKKEYSDNALGTMKKPQNIETRLTAMEPTDFDKELAALYGERHSKLMEQYVLRERLQKVERFNSKLEQKAAEDGVSIDNHSHYSHKYLSNNETIREYTSKIEKLGKEVNVLQKKIAPYDKVFRDRGGWNRAYIVPNGHVHNSMECSTCFPTTKFEWVTGFSGKEEKEIVEAAGERACTVCYPSAPVDVLSRPSQMMTVDERKKADERAEREKKREQQRKRDNEKGITSPDGSPLRINGFVIKTERSAEIKLVDNLTEEMLRNKDIEEGDKWGLYDGDFTWEDNVKNLQRLNDMYAKEKNALVEALAAKRGVETEDVLNSVADRVQKKFKQRYRESEKNRKEYMEWNKK